MAKLEKKIFLDKSDDLNKAVDSLISTSAEKIILNIPKNSVLGLSVHNFQVLERESETAGKELVIESVDERVLELASLATIPAVNPVFKFKEKAVADIVLASHPTEEEKPAKKTEDRKKKPKRGRKKKESATDEKLIPIVSKKEELLAEKAEPLEMMEDIIPKHEPAFKKEAVGEIVEYIPAPKVEERIKNRSKRGRRFWITTLSILIIVVGAGYFAVTDILPRVTINISIQKTSISFANPVIMDTSINTPRVEGNVVNLPGQLTVAKSNLSMNFPATGSSTVSTKAGGTLTVYNNYSAKPQLLVATTRFQSPDGKIFRLVSNSTIPGAKVANGKITPSSIDVQVTADQSGSDYNVPPGQNWQIPGFKGTPRYGKFYAEAKTSMTGGASGNQIVPTKNDIAQAKIKIGDALSDNLKSKTLILNSQNLKLLENASAFNITSENIGSQVDKDNNFSIFAAGELRQLVFDENMLRDALLKSLSVSTTDFKIDNFSINYGTSTSDLAAGKMTFSVNGTLVYEPKIDFDAFKNKILGLDADTLKAQIFTLPGLEKANIAFWPFWINSVPKRVSHVNLVTE